MIRGIVVDPSGAVVEQAVVTITDTSTGASRLTKTNADGAYEVFGLRSGTYKASVQAAGSAPREINGIVLNGSSVFGLNVTLQVSSAQEAVEVNASAPAINTENPTIAGTIASSAVIDLPRDSRDVYSFLYLNPNITQADAPGDFKFTGFQSYGASFSLDGQRSSGGIFGAQTASEPSLEAVDQLNVLSDNFSAEYAGIANIRITTKRGTNQFHGSLFYNNENSALAAMTLQDQIGKQTSHRLLCSPGIPTHHSTSMISADRWVDRCQSFAKRGSLLRTSAITTFLLYTFRGTKSPILISMPVISLHWTLQCCRMYPRVSR